MILTKKHLEVFKPDNSIRRFGQAGQGNFNGQLNVLVWNIFKAKRVEFSADFTALFQDQDIVML